MNDLLYLYLSKGHLHSDTRVAWDSPRRVHNSRYRSAQMTRDEQSWRGVSFLGETGPAIMTTGLVKHIKKLHMGVVLPNL